MATRNIVPRATGEGGIGTATKHWGAGHFDTLPNWQEYLAESTGYGIVSGCEPTISGLTVTVGAGVVHLADGTRKEIASTNITLDAADSTNPRIDLVYIDSTGEVAKVTGTAVASPSAPSVPTGGISVAQVRVAANDTTGVIVDSRTWNALPNNLYMRSGPKDFETFDKTLGLSIHRTSWIDSHLEVIYNSPFTLIRNDLDWKDYETSAGVYNFSYPLGIAKKLYSHGKLCSWIFAFSNPLYTSSDKSGINTENARTAFKNYCIAWVQLMVDNGITGQCYEIYNEPNNPNFWSVDQSISAANYTELVKLVYPAIKAIDPTATIITHDIMDALYARGMMWLTETIDRGILDYTDGVSIHPYSPDMPETMSQAFIKARTLIDNATDKYIPLYCLEVGYSACPNYDGTGLNAIADEPLRKKYIPRLLLNNIMHGVVGTALYMGFHLTDNLLNNDSEKLFGIYLQNGGETETSKAISNLANLLKGANYQGIIYKSQNVNVLKFIQPNGNIKYIGWCYGISSKTITINGQAFTITDEPTAINILGNIQVNDAKNNANNVYDVSHSSIVSIPKNEYDVTDVNYEDQPSVIGRVKNCAVFGFGTKAIGNNSLVAGYHCISEENCFAAGFYNVAIAGEKKDITATNSNVITLDSVSGINVGAAVAVCGTWKKPLLRIVLAVASSNVTLDKDVPSGYDTVVCPNSNVSGATALGAANISTNNSSFTTGYNNRNYGEGSLVAGMNNILTASSCIVCGSWNNPVEPNVDRIIVGNGTNNARSNGFRVTANGDVYAALTYHTTGADYAEYFEWADGNADAADRVGYFVTFDSDKKIRLADANDDYILGIISGNPATLGNSYNDQWEGMCVTDDFGRIQYEEVEVEAITDGEGNIIVPAHSEKRPVINPDYDNTQEYIGRENRKEWSAVGMLGVLPVRDDGTCEVNGYCKVADGGIATKANSGYRVIERVSENVVKIVFR